MLLRRNISFLIADYDSVIYKTVCLAKNRVNRCDRLRLSKLLVLDHFLSISCA